MRADSGTWRARPDAVVHRRRTAKPSDSATDGACVGAQVREHLGERRLHRGAARVAAPLKTRGSRMVSASNATRRPGNPTKKNTSCHGYTSPTSGTVTMPGLSTRPTTYAPSAYATPDPRNVPHHVRAHRPRRVAYAELVGNDRHGGRAERGLACPHANTGQEQMRVAACRAGQHGHDAPHHRAERHDPRAMSAIHPASDRQQAASRTRRSQVP